MRIIVCGPRCYNYSSSIVTALRELGHEALYFPMTDFYVECSYLVRKLYKMGCGVLKRRWLAKWEKQFSDYLRAHYDGDRDGVKTVVWILTPNLLDETMLKKLAQYRKVLFLWDSIKRSQVDLLPRLQYYERVYAFEYHDVDYIKSTAKKTDVYYLPLGYDEKIYYPSAKERDIDICFVGLGSNERVKILNEVAGFAWENHYKMVVVGNWYDKRHFWKRAGFKRKYPQLYACIQNHLIDAAEVASLYQRSKICLNLNTPIHKSISPRTFEILATRSFQIMNSGQQLRGMVAPGEDLVEFTDTEDLLHLLQYYLQHPREREQIAASGYDRVSGRYSIKELCKRGLQEMA